MIVWRVLWIKWYLKIIYLSMPENIQQNLESGKSSSANELNEAIKRIQLLTIGVPVKVKKHVAVFHAPYLKVYDCSQDVLRKQEYFITQLFI